MTRAKNVFPTEGGEAVTVSESSSVTDIESNADEARKQKKQFQTYPSLGLAK